MGQNMQYIFFFEVMANINNFFFFSPGEVNPLLEKSYMDLTLHQRVWILKCLCDNSLVRLKI